MTSCSIPVIAPPATYLPGAAMFHGAIGRPALAATPDTPLPVRAVPGSAELSLIERLNREGDGGPGYAEQTYSSFTIAGGAGTVLATPGNPAPGRALFYGTVSIWSPTTPVVGRFQINTPGTTWPGVGTFPPMDTGFSAGPGYHAQLPVNAFCRSGDRGGIGAYLKRWVDPAVSGSHTIAVGANVWTLADSINFDARRVILMLGDSTWNGTGPSSVATCVPYLINQWYRQQGQDTRYILKAYSGSTTSGHHWLRESGKYEFPQVDAIFVNLGINDAGQSYTTDGATPGGNASMPNVRALVAWKQKRYPAAKLVLFGSTPLQPAASEAALAALRAAIGTYVAGLGDPNVLFCDLGGSFDRTVGGNYVASDGADGIRIHPADAGLTQLWAGGYNGNAGLRAWLGTNLPVI